jgi:morphogenetic protein associated with SpoVID
MKIKSGDTLSQIAKDKGMTLKALLGANPKIKNANSIRVGQTINIPDTGKMAGSASKNPYAGMTRTQMAQMDVKNKNEKAQQTATRSMQSQVKQGGSKTTPSKPNKNTGSSMNMSKFEQKKQEMIAKNKKKYGSKG